MFCAIFNIMYRQVNHFIPGILVNTDSILPPSVHIVVNRNLGLLLNVALCPVLFYLMCNIYHVL